jgi:zinc protease
MFARLLLMVVALLAGLSAAQASPEIKHWNTSNGVEVYYVKAPELPMLDVRVVFDAGAARDGDKQGLALLTNSMLDEGAAGMTTDQIAEAFENVGAEFDVSSQRDMAMLSLRTLTDKAVLDTSIATFTKVLSQPEFPESSFERLRKQVLLGLQAEKQSPGSISKRAFFSKLYGDHPYSIMPSGTEESVAKLSVADLKAFYQQYYVANNAQLILVGDISAKQAKALAETISAGLQAGQAAPTLPEVPAIKQGETVNIAYPSSQTHVLMGQLGVSRDDPDYFPLYVGNHILGGSGLVSMLSDEVREKRGLSYSVYSYLLPMHQQGPYLFGLQTKNSQAEQALTVMRDTVDKFTKEGPTQAQLTAAKQNITGGFALRVDSNSKIAGYLAMIGFYHLPLDYLNTFIDKVNAVTTEQIHDAFQRRVHTNKMITVLVGGESKQDSSK